jgi:hypothetical protein
MHTRKNILFVALFAALMLASCTTTSVDVPPMKVQDSTSTYSLIKSQIIQVSCVQCHNTKDASINGHLALDSDNAYASMVGVSPYNTVAAKADSMLRIYMGHPEHSFLINKLSGLLEPGMGDQMPNGHPLSAGKVNFIRQWILAGCPRTGSVADANLLKDSSNDLQAALVPLAVPALGTGFQIHMPEYTIPAGSEREIFLYKNNPNTQTQYVNSMDIRMREGSHHFILWAVDGQAEGLTDGQLRDRNDNEMSRNRDFTSGAQTLEYHYDFPAGVALALTPNKGFDLNSHYVNPTNQTMHGEAYINVFTTQASAVQHVATPFLISDNNFTIPAHSTYTRKLKWPAQTVPTHLFMLTSHTHRHLISFKVWKQGPTGQPIYSNLDWHEPTVVNMDLVLQPGESLYSETTWQNDGSTPLRFGLTSEDEMNILLGYYWQ